METEPANAKESSVTFRRVRALIITLCLAAPAAAVIAAVDYLSAAVNVGKSVRAAGDVRFFEQQLTAYREANGSFPSTAQGLEALAKELQTSPHPLRWRRMVEDVIKDDWDNDYIYRCPGLTH